MLACSHVCEGIFFFFCRKAQPTVGNAIPVDIGIRKVAEHAPETEPKGSISS